MPMREIYSKYTRSELHVLAWESKQKANNTHKMLSRNKSEDGSIGSSVTETANAYILPSGVNNNVPIPKKLVNERGELDLRKGTGDDAFNYLTKLGIPLMRM